MKVIIAGAGIGGLVAGLYLHQLGHDVRIYESVATIRPLGVGINLLPHAVRVLDVLGLQDALEAVAIRTAELIYYNKFGQLIWREPRGLEAGNPWPQYSIHRGKLQMLLWDAAIERLGADRVKTGCHLAHFCEVGRGIEATFVDRQSRLEVTKDSGDILIGADGIHSEVRRHFYPLEGPPRYSGLLLWRGISMAQPFLTGRSMIMAGNGQQKFVAYPIGYDADTSGRMLINWIAELRVESAELVPRDWNRRVEPEKFAPAFQTWKFDWLDIPAIISSAESIYEFPMSDRDPLSRWSFGRITLLGDAAHPMYPIGSNGASQAILDAESLGNALNCHDDVEPALQQYDRERREPTSAVVLSNRQMGPEVVMRIVDERAPDGFARLDDVISQAELQDIANRYKRVAGFDPSHLNALRLGK